MTDTNTRDIQKYAEDYRTHYGFERYQVQFRRRKVLECIQQHPHDRLLEVGCGTEPLFCHMSDFQTCAIVEPSQAFIRNARDLAGTDARMIFSPGTLEDKIDELRTCEYDFIVVSSLLHEVSDPDGFMHSVHSLCAPATIVHVNVPNANSFHMQLGKQMGVVKNVFDKSELAHFFQRTTTYNLATLKTFVSGCGFEVISFGSYFLKPFSHGQMDKMFAQGIIDEAVLEGLYGMTKNFPDCGSEIFVNLRKL